MAFTYFFRDLATLEAIRDHVVPLLRTRRYIHVWDAGCAMGPEPYSLAIVLRENMGSMIFRNVRIHATDIDGSNLFGQVIARGEYPFEEIQRIPEELRLKYFQPTDDKDKWQLTDEMRHSVKFKQHDLLTLAPIGDGFNLIMCKNVLLHFSEAERIQVIRMFHAALADDGHFVTEQTQKLPAEVEHLFQPVAANSQLYRRLPAK